jgi:hypothetical protein
LISFLTGCSASVSKNNTQKNQSYISRYLVPNQLPPPQSIKSVQLHRKGNKNSPPIIQLGSSQRLTLSFDELTDLSGQFRVTFTHYDENWNPSNIPLDWFLDDMQEIIVGGGSRNELSDPDYFHYSTTFPNNQLNFLISGNYMLHVSDFNSGTRLFSLPFFVTENAGSISSWVETNYNAGSRYEALDRPFSEFVYPDFIEFPEFDLSFKFVQNRFWGDARTSDSYDFTEEDRSQFYLDTDKAFAANFDFIGLNLNSFSQNNNEIIEWRPELNPPLVVLREDVLNFTSDPAIGWSSTFGIPKDGTDARYANVNFRFEGGSQISNQRGVYLIGDFNQWLLADRYKLEYEESTGYWETTVLIKEGNYTYKYATKDDYRGINDLILSDTITRQQQEYTSFVYYQDPDYKYYRLLQVEVFSTNNN